MSIGINNSNTNIRQVSQTSNSKKPFFKVEDYEDEILKVKVGDKKEKELDDKDKKTLKYVLVGDVIKVFLVSNGGEKKELLKTIPVMQASPEVLAQCENITLMDIITIMEKQEEEKHGDDEKSMGEGGAATDKASKGVSEYLKHDSPITSTT